MIGNYPVDFYELACRGKDLKDGKCLGIQKPESCQLPQPIEVGACKSSS